MNSSRIQRHRVRKDPHPHMPLPAVTKSPTVLLLLGSLPLEPSFLRQSMNDEELKDSGSSRDCSFTNKYFVLPTNLSTILSIKPKYLSTAPKFLQGSFSASQTLFSVKSNPHCYPRPFLSLNFHSAFLTSFTVR